MRKISFAEALVVVLTIVVAALINGAIKVDNRLDDISDDICVLQSRIQTMGFMDNIK